MKTPSSLFILALICLLFLVDARPQLVTARPPLFTARPPQVNPIPEPLAINPSTSTPEQHQHSALTTEPSSKVQFEHIKTLSQGFQDLKAYLLSIEGVKSVIEAMALDQYLSKAKMEWKELGKKACSAKIEVGKDGQGSKVVELEKERAEL